MHATRIDFYRRCARLVSREIPHSGSPHAPTADDLLELRGSAPAPTNEAMTSFVQNDRLLGVVVRH
ncbi:hypothetical protein [Streptomyces sp. NPDC057557]|uniref:hypothetical protein n=1 Tax=Streptomyces sp. NPDC057557 TaxID=3346167 RepID=UPI00367E2D76